MSISVWLTEALLQWLACIVAVSPLVIVAIRKRQQYSKRSIPARPLAILAAFFFVSLALARSSRAFNWINAPWQGMSLEAAFALIVIVFTNSQPHQYGENQPQSVVPDQNKESTKKPLTRGLRLAITRRAWRDTLLATLLLCGYVLIRSMGLRMIGHKEPGTSLNIEYLLYLLTLPGIAEELAYRGVIQSCLNNLFDKPWNFFGTPLGWGWAITGFLFWSIHAFQVNGWSINFYWPTLTLPLIAGLVFGWMRERSNSLLPPILAHNLINVIGALL